MATKFKLKRSTIGGIVPTTGDIDTAELAVNLADKKLYTSNGTVVFEIGSNLTNLSVSGNLTVNAIIANGSVGTAGQVLHSNGTSVYWDTDDQGVTSVATGVGLTGGPITNTGTISVLANNGITANTTGIYVTQGTGTVVNATGVHVNSAYIETLTVNNSTNLDGQPASFYTNATNITTGTLDTARLPATANISTAVNIGSNALTVGTSAFFVANGNVGIGTSSPESSLHVVGDARVSSINNGPLAGFRNAIINGNFQLAQRATSFVAGANNDDTYNLDRWYILSDGNDAVDITQSTTEIPADGSQTSIALDVETINKKFGIAQIIEQRNCQGLIGNTVTLSFKAKVSSTTKLDNVKAAIVAWSGTADSVTSDIISAWGSEGTNPTLIANATYENSPANLSVTPSWASYSITAAVDTSSTGNIIVFIWSDVTDTTLGDFLYITDVQIEAGPVATPFERRPIGTELALCQRYYCETIFNIRFRAQVVDEFHEDAAYWPQSMRAEPTATLTISPSGGTTNIDNLYTYGARIRLTSTTTGDVFALNGVIKATAEL